MNLTIFKYLIAITDRQDIKIPKGGKILSVQYQYPNTCVWVMVDELQPKESRSFEVFGTGHIIEPNETRQFLGTIQQPNGLVFHIFEIENKNQ